MPSSYDSFRDIPRVPRADEHGNQISAGGIAPYKKAISYGKPVSLEEALANMSKRRRGELDKIEGGLDDEDPSLYIHPTDASPFKKMVVAQHGALTQEEVRALKEGKAEVEPVATEEPGAIGGPAGAVSTVLRQAPVLEPEYAEVDTKTGKKRRKSVQVVYKEVPVEKVVYKDKIVEKKVEVVKEVVKDGPFETWAKQRTRIQIGTTETTFNISAVAVLQSIYGITVILPTANDAMTFVPRTGAVVKLGLKDDSINTIFTGVSFDIEELRIMGLCFLKKKEEVDKEEP